MPVRNLGDAWCTRCRIGEARALGPRRIIAIERARTSLGQCRIGRAKDRPAGVKALGRVISVAVGGRKPAEVQPVSFNWLESSNFCTTQLPKFDQTVLWIIGAVLKDTLSEL